MGGSGLKGYPQDDVFAVADAPLDAAGAVAAGAPAAGGHVKLVVVLLARQVGAGKPRADLKPLAGWQGHHRLGQVGLQLVKHRGSQPARHPAGYTLHHSPQRIPFPRRLLNFLDHGRRRLGIGAADDVGLHLLCSYRAGIHLGFHVFYPLHVGQDLHPCR
jgi:hypothetical protein